MAEARIIDGKAFAERPARAHRRRGRRLKAEHGLKPGLAVVLVGEDPASQVYVRNKGEQTAAAGMHSVTHRLPADTTQADLLALVRELNADPAIHGILVQLPAARPHRQRRRRRRHRSGQGRRRPARGQRRPPGQRACRAWCPARRWAA